MGAHFQLIIIYSWMIWTYNHSRSPAGDEKLQGMFDALSGSAGVTVHAWSCDVADAGKTRQMLKMLGLDSWMFLEKNWGN